MRHIRMLPVLALLLASAGCTLTAQGTALREPDCAVVGFEDLTASDPGCGKMLEVEGLTDDITAREVDVQGEPVTYLILDEPLTDGIFAMDMTGIVARDYAHVLVSDVQRYQNMDVATIYASDDCAVDAWYDVPIGERDGCALNNIFLSGRQLSAAEAARVITQHMVDRIEQVAGDSKRFAAYVLVLAAKP